MKSTLDSLTPNDKEALAHLYELPGYKALVKLCNLEIKGLAADCLASQNMEMVKYLSGQATMAAKLPKLIRQLYKEKDES